MFFENTFSSASHTRIISVTGQSSFGKNGCLFSWNLVVVVVKVSSRPFTSPSCSVKIGDSLKTWCQSDGGRCRIVVVVVVIAVILKTRQGQGICQGNILAKFKVTRLRALPTRGSTQQQHFWLWQRQRRGRPRRVGLLGGRRRGRKLVGRRKREHGLDVFDVLR